MAKRVCCAQIRVPEIPRVRFYAKAPQEKKGFRDVTGTVVRLAIEVIGNDTGRFALQRFNADGALVWVTTHASLQETKWHAEFEYGLPEEKWQPCSSREEVTSPAVGR